MPLISLSLQIETFKVALCLVGVCNVQANGLLADMLHKYVTSFSGHLLFLHTARKRELGHVFQM